MIDQGKAYEGWGTEAHREVFDLWNRKSDWEFFFSFGSFAENRYLRRAISSMKCPRILDVGCATGATYRYLRGLPSSQGFHYLGVDLSKPAISRARSLYPEANFHTKGLERLMDVTGETYDVVYSRDTVMHQTNPYGFLADLLDVAASVLIVRLRTRDKGETVMNPELSCQMHYDAYWMPYIVLNTEELLEFLRAYPRTSRIELNRSYEVLGGQNFRYLPKELYVSEAGGAESALLIHLSDESQPREADVVVADQLEGHAFLRAHKLGWRIRSAWSRVRPFS